MKDLGWIQSQSDAKTHYSSTGKDGFLVVTSEGNHDKAEGCVLPLVYANGTGWIGYFCINEPFRGKGHGAKLFSAAMDHFKTRSVNIVGLDAVQDQVETYARRGFVEKGRVHLMQYQATAQTEISGLEPPNETKLLSLQDVPEQRVRKSDLDHIGLERSNLWTKSALLSRADVYGLALVDDPASTDNNLSLRGWMLIRSCQQGYHIGPLYSTSTRDAEVLLRAAMRGVLDQRGKQKDNDDVESERSFIAEVWTENPKAVQLFQKVGFSAMGTDYHRMWLHGKVPREQEVGGRASSDVYAMFDAGEG